MQFVDGLKPSIRRKISVDNISSLEESYHLFLKMEKHAYEEKMKE